ncbi:MAG: 3-oxoacyl-[acyl-carrier protein] reductase [Chlamydiales bacterium]|jgi:3-oxoacyl-[acyl-carrier protein] reductase
MDFKGKKALVTGASEGIGRAIAAAFIARGAEVAITGRRAAQLEKTGAELGAWALPGDVSVEADVVATMDAFVERHGRIDVLVNNAGFGYSSPLVELDRQRFDAVFATNVTGAMLMGREAAKHFIRQGDGHLVNISSTSGLKGGRNASAYSASKFALRGMTECWRAELRPHNVRVILVNPSEVLTNFSKHAGHEQKHSDRKLRPEEIADALVGVMEMDDRGFVPELSVFATNPF